MPGLVDCHTHHNGFGDGRRADSLATLSDELLTLQSAHNAMRSLFTGVTTIRENGSKNATTLRLRDAINQGITIGPRMVLCGRAIAIIGGHMGYFGGEATGPVEVRAMTRQLFKEGADYIKITATGGTTKTSFPMRPSFNVDELKAITDEAHKFGKLTATHCTSTQGIINSLGCRRGHDNPLPFQGCRWVRQLQRGRCGTHRARGQIRQPHPAHHQDYRLGSPTQTAAGVDTSRAGAC